MSFDHNKLVTHGIATTDESQGPVTAVLFDLKAFKAAGNESNLEGTALFKLADVHPEAVRLLMSAAHLYQQVVRNTIGLKHMKSEIEQARTMRAIGPIFASELISWIDELQQLNRATRTLVIEGQEASDAIITKQNGVNKQS